MSDAELQETRREEVVEPVDTRRDDVVESERPVVREEEPVREERIVRVDRGMRWSPAQIVLVAAGAMFIVFGLVAMIRGGLSTPLDQPFVQVFGYAQTPLPGVIEAGAGVVLLLAGLIPNARIFGMFLGALSAISGGLILGNLDWINAHLTTDKDFGWIPLIAGGAVVVVLGLVPSLASPKTVYRH